MKYDTVAIGELNVDLILSGMSSPPALGQELFASGMDLQLGSSTAIAACAMSSLGLKTAFYGRMGNDAYGQVVQKHLRKYNVDTSFVEIKDGYETGITVSLSCGHDRALCTYMGDSINGFAAWEVPEALLSLTRHIHVGSFFLQSRIREGLTGLFAKARALGVVTSLDAGWDDTLRFDYGIRDVLRHTDFFFPNETEALNITGRKSVAEAAAKLSQYCKTVVVKRGDKGAYLQSGDTNLTGMPYKVTPVDTTGAGDTFNAGFMAAYLNGKSLSDCLKYGNAAGAVSVTRMGGTSACPTPGEVEAMIAFQRLKPE